MLYFSLPQTKLFFCTAPLTRANILVRMLCTEPEPSAIHFSMALGEWFGGAPGVNRTPNLLVRSQPLYPIVPPSVCLGAGSRPLFHSGREATNDTMSLKVSILFKTNGVPGRI